MPAAERQQAPGEHAERRGPSEQEEELGERGWRGVRWCSRGREGTRAFVFEDILQLHGDDRAPRLRADHTAAGRCVEDISPVCPEDIRAVWHLPVSVAAVRFRTVVRTTNH